MEKFQSYPKISRESFIRQSTGSFVGKGDLGNGLREARNLRDTKFIDNSNSKEKMSRRPHGHSFKAVALLKKKYESQDQYLIYEIMMGAKLTSLLFLKVAKGMLKY